MTDRQLGWRYDAFISYRRSDGSTVARWLYTKLRRYKLPRGFDRGRARKLAIYLDTAYEQASDDFFERNIRPSLESSRFLLIVATPDTLLPRADGTKNWVEREIDVFAASAIEGRILVVRAAGPDLAGSLPSGLHLRFPNLDIVDFRGLTNLSSFSLRRRFAFHDKALNLVAALLDVPPENMPRLRVEETRRRVLRLLTKAAVSSVLAVVLAATAGWYLQPSAIRDIAAALPLEPCRAEPRGSVVQRFERGWIVARFSSNMFYGIRQDIPAVRWWSLPDPYTGRNVSCVGVQNEHLLQRGFRTAYCESSLQDMLRTQLGEPLTYEGRALLQYQRWSSGLLIVGLPGTNIGLAKNPEDQQKEFAALDTVFLRNIGARSDGVGASTRISGTGGKAYCSAIWFPSVNGVDWRGLAHPSSCTTIREEAFYLRPRFSCDVGQ